MVIHTNTKPLLRFSMVKYLSCAVLFLLCFSSCKKDETDKCWRCTVYSDYVGGTVLFKEESCRENLYNKQYADANGNPLQSYCEEL